MKYGCIGEHLKHSFSKEIHNALADYEYEIREIPKDELTNFAEERNFSAINVTIPYKELIMPHMYFIDEHAKEIGAVNTVVNRSGKLYGYNTDFYGMSMLIKHAGIEIKDKKVVILGTGGTSKTSLAVAKALGAKSIVRVSRSTREDAISYSALYEVHSDADVSINTTPSGMFPNISDSPVDLTQFKKLSGVIDAVYNPLRTSLVLEAQKRGIAAEGGLYMLVAQAVKASEIFIDTKYSDTETERVFKKMMRDKENIVLIGMPASGKITVGKILSEKYERELIDTDSLIEKRAEKSISDIFKENGEAEFRRLESEIIDEVSAKTGVIISTGGGAVLNGRNVTSLRKNGKLYFIDRPLECLLPTSDRPLASTREDIKKRYAERYNIYTARADVRVLADCDAECVAGKIERNFEQ